MEPIASASESMESVAKSSSSRLESSMTLESTDELANFEETTAACLRWVELNISSAMELVVSWLSSISTLKTSLSTTSGPSMESTPKTRELNDAETRFELVTALESMCSEPIAASRRGCHSMRLLSNVPEKEGI